MVLEDLTSDDGPNFLGSQLLYCRIQRSKHCLSIDLQVCPSDFYTFQIMKVSRYHLTGQPGEGERQHRALAVLL